MKIAFATVDLIKGRERLMPWRTIIEVAKYAMRHGHEVAVLTMSVSGENVAYEFEGVNVLNSPREFNAFCEYLAELKIDVLYYPTPWREGLRNLSAFGQLHCVKVAYFPGGSVRWENIWALGKHAGWKIAKPFLIDRLTPYRILMNKLADAGFSTVITQSPYTEKTCIHGGFKNVKMIVPGKDDFEELDDNENILKQLKMKGKTYILFAGAPAPIRGASLLLKAIDRAAAIDNSIFCLFLMREDVGSKFSEFDKTYQQMVHKENVEIVRRKLDRNELKTVMGHARSVALPFLLVPSEIPITFFEVLSLGIPVVSFENGGTTEYLGDSVLVSSPGKLGGLTENLLRIWQDDTLYSEMQKRALQRMSQHPTWDEVAQRWLACIK